jgi:hypothetical protein
MGGGEYERLSRESTATRQGPEVDGNSSGEEESEDPQQPLAGAAASHGSSMSVCGGCCHTVPKAAAGLLVVGLCAAAAIAAVVLLLSAGEDGGGGGVQQGEEAERQMHGAARGVCIFDVDLTLSCGGDCNDSACAPTSTSAGLGCIDTAVSRGYPLGMGYPLRHNVEGTERVLAWCSAQGYERAVATHGSAEELSHVGNCSRSKLEYIEDWVWHDASAGADNGRREVGAPDGDGPTPSKRCRDIRDTITPTTDHPSASPTTNHTDGRTRISAWGSSSSGGGGAPPDFDGGAGGYVPPPSLCFWGGGWDGGAHVAKDVHVAAIVRSFASLGPRPANFTVVFFDDSAKNRRDVRRGARPAQGEQQGYRAADGGWG